MAGLSRAVDNQPRFFLDTLSPLCIVFQNKDLTSQMSTQYLLPRIHPLPSSFVKQYEREMISKRTLATSKSRPWWTDGVFAIFWPLSHNGSA